MSSSDSEFNEFIEMEISDTSSQESVLNSGIDSETSSVSDNVSENESPILCSENEESIIIEDTFDIETRFDEGNESLNTFQIMLEEMFSKLYLTGTTRETMNHVAKKMINLFELVEDVIISKVNKPDEKSLIEFHFTEFKDLLFEKSTAYRRKKDEKENEFFVEPVPVAFGTTLIKQRKKNKQIMVQKALELYKVPVEKTLDALLHSNLFKNTILNKNHECVPGHYKSVCCGSVFQNCSLNDITNPNTPILIQLYYDAVNLGDSNKQNANKYKIGAFYFRVLNLPSNLQSLHKNIHLVAVFNENDLKKSENGFNSVLKLVVDEFQHLEEKGLNVKIMDEVLTLPVGVCSVAADNLGCRQMAGLFFFFVFGIS